MNHDNFDGQDNKYPWKSQIIDGNKEKNQETTTTASQQINPIEMDNFNIQMIEDEAKPFKCVDRYLVGKTLGKGSYSKVKEIFDTEFLVRRAVKLIKRRILKKIPEGDGSVETEIRILRTLNHPNIIKLYDVMCDQAKETIYLVIDYCACDIMSMLRSNEKILQFPLWQAHHYFKQLINGVEYLHSQSILHKDIKPANLLINLGQTLKICDFGVSEKLNIFSPNLNCNDSQGTPIFQPPEVNLSIRPFPGDKLDIWGCGVCLYFMIFGTLPFGETNIYKIIETICRCEYSIPTIENDTNGSVEWLIKNILVKNPNDRITIEKIKNSDWLLSESPKIGKAIPFPSNKFKNSNIDMTLTSKLDIFVREYNSLNSHQSQLGSITSTKVRKNSSRRHSVISSFLHQNKSAGSDSDEIFQDKGSN